MQSSITGVVIVSSRLNVGSHWKVTSVITPRRPILTWAALKISLDWVALTVRIWKQNTESKNQLFPEPWG